MGGRLAKKSKSFIFLHTIFTVSRLLVKWDSSSARLLISQMMVLPLILYSFKSLAVRAHVWVKASWYLA